MREIDLAIVGDIAWNKDITPQGQRTSPGGAAYYSAAGASHFSEKVGVVGRIGEDFDLSLLQKRHIDVEGVIVVPEEETCRFVLTQYLDNTRDFEAIRGVAGIVQTDIFPDRYLSARFIHLPTQLPEHSITWLDFLSHHNGISVDSFEEFTRQWPELTKEMFRRANIIFTNEEEWKTLSMFGVEFAEKPIIIKRGKGGATYKNGSESITISAPSVTAIETTGAGDVLAGAFLAQRVQDVPIGSALENAVNLASLSVQAFGIEHIPPKEAMIKKPHIITAALLVNTSGEVFLAASPKFGGKLIVPGGHFLPGETPEECIIREVEEETGINVDRSNLRFLKMHEIYAPEYHGTGARFIGYNYWLFINDQTIRLEENEFSSCLFVDPNEALKLPDLHPSARKIIQYYLEERDRTLR
ncbi:hypothetical protein A3H83_00530 [Candidatus Roizmanbacteria bacterium RIFCSPLOWO2_02_FULL_39_8]|uniref:Nudix hydrolase domain-containing protein n=1 Tax=Candidatus Daviesbacteria bacterium RIFCSPHIGHO2_12_FULL_43_11 TaxID=1797780 RepID=A0A1F5K3L9_9BACT|nr:MAG: hypothetical protein A3E45_00080 [Candidatus Daviesbacteria bacterium RIFCSPHIGHO2_12_FULL_43_11]OGK56875.1 MAG: hypothetical protein A3H83_00530 [Candidatus Roizmanbacteria bacterium RIFCSPLOWO2_02_FULL_39_8]